MSGPPVRMRLLLARHGESVWNAEKRFQGHTDIALSARGRAQAEALGRALRGYKVAAAYVSPFRRARETAALALRESGVAPTVIEELRERAALERIAAQHAKGEDVLIVSHGGVISVYACHLLGCSFNQLWRLRVDNASLTVVRPPRLVSLNDTAHLTGDLIPAHLQRGAIAARSEATP